MLMTQEQINALNNMNPVFQNLQLGTLLASVIGGDPPSGSISTDEIALLAITEALLANNAVTDGKLGADVKVGSLASLTTTAKNNIVAAINELVSSLSSGLADKLVQTSEIKNLISGSIQLNGVNPTGVNFGSSSAATVTSSNSETYDLTGVGDGGTIIINPDGDGEATATVNFAAGNSISGATPSTDISAGLDNKFKIQVRGDTAEVVELTLAGLSSGAAIATEMQTKIQALGGNKASVTVDYNVTSAGKYSIVDNILGTSSSIVVTRADDHNVTEELEIGVGDGGTETAGTGDVANAAAATASELAIVVNDDISLVTADGSSGSLVIVSDTTGRTSSLVIGAGTLNTVVGFTGAAAYYGRQGLGLTDAENTNFRVLPVISGVVAASLASLNLSVTNKATTGFDLECETTASEAVVDLFIVGDLT